jgi:hypothetical protein
MDHSETYSGVPTIGRNDSASKPPASPAPQAVQVEVDDSKALTHYANFCRLSGMPEELLIDFGLNPRPMGITVQPVVVTQRVVTGWHTAKRLLHVLQRAVERHEAAFGVLETDVQKRVRRTQAKRRN